MTKVNELKEKDRLTQYMLVKSVTQGVTNKGKPYLNLALQDNTGVIDAKFWDVKPEEIATVKAGNVMNVSFEVLDYNHALQLRVHKMETVDQDEIEISDFIMTSSISVDELKKDIQEKIDSIQNGNLKKLVEGMYAKCGKRFFLYPAASRIHHNYLGGLAEHTLGMANLAESIAEEYPQLNRDLLISGILIHDMGKTAELGGLISSEYTDEGRLIGHISICHGWLMEVAEELGLEDSEEAMCLRHLVLAHHGHQEFGSPVLPQLQEAEVLYLIDNMDARLNTLRQQMEHTKPGTWTQKLFSLENRQFYKPKMGSD